MMHVHKAGNSASPAIVFLHGAGLSGLQWQPQMQALAAEFFCLAPDLPEQGRTTDGVPFTLEGAADAVAALIRERVPAGPAHVVGLSLGGAVALQLAKRCPARVDRLIVSGTSAGLGKTLGGIMRASAAMYGWFPADWLVGQVFSQFAIPAAYHALLRDDVRRGMGVDFNRRAADALMAVELPEQAQALVLVGTQETVVARRDARRLVQAISGAQGYRVPRAGHVWNLQHADLFTQTVRAFITGAALPPALEPL